MTFDEFIEKAYSVVVEPLLFLIFGLAFIMFIWGVFEFIRDSEESKGREQGKQNIIWGAVGMVIMVSAFGIINIIMGTFGITKTPKQTEIDNRFDATIQGIDVDDSSN
jgi:ABC-type phosphate transport system permease subunit